MLGYFFLLSYSFLLTFTWSGPKYLKQICIQHILSSLVSSTTSSVYLTCKAKLFVQDILARAVDQWQCVNSLEGEEKTKKLNICQGAIFWFGKSLKCTISALKCTIYENMKKNLRLHIWSESNQLNFEIPESLNTVLGS